MTPRRTPRRTDEPLYIPTSSGDEVEMALYEETYLPDDRLELRLAPDPTLGPAFLVREAGDTEAHIDTHARAREPMSGYQRFRLRSRPVLVGGCDG